MSPAQHTGRGGKGEIVAEKTPRKPQAKAKKKAWEAPRVKSGRLFESNSLACGKAHDDGPGGMCRAAATLS
jgi:hypothetical protein